MVTNNFGNRNFMQPMGMLTMHSKCLDFIFFLNFGGRGEGGGFFLFSFVPITFPSSSHWVPNMFLKFQGCSQ